MTHHRTATLALAASLLVPAAALEAQCVRDQAPVLSPSDGAVGDYFGVRTAIEGNLAVVTARFAEGHGAAYVYRFDGSSWEEEAKLTPSDSGDWFGRSVAISGNVIVVGARDAGPSSAGAAYVYRHDGCAWKEEAILRPADLASGNRFGIGADIRSDLIVVGASRHQGSGAAYVYRYDAGDLDTDGVLWDFEQKLVPSDSPGSAHFGSAASISRDTIILGAPGADGLGAAYVFVSDPDDLDLDGDLWEEQAKLSASDGVSGDCFGIDAKVQRDVALVSADQEDSNGPGAVYVYRRTGSVWTEEARLDPDDGAPNDHFNDIALQYPYAVVGATFHTSQTGQAYVFAHDELAGTWDLRAKLRSESPAPEDYFGVVACDGGRLIVGAYQATSGGIGNARVFDGLGDANANGILDLCEPVCPGDIDGDGDVDVLDFAILAANFGCVP